VKTLFPEQVSDLRTWPLVGESDSAAPDGLPDLLSELTVEYQANSLHPFLSLSLWTPRRGWLRSALKRVDVYAKLGKSMEIYFQFNK